MEGEDSSFLGKLFWGYLAYRVITKPFRKEIPEDIYWEEYINVGWLDTRYNFLYSSLREYENTPYFTP